MITVHAKANSPILKVMEVTKQEVTKTRSHYIYKEKVAGVSHTHGNRLNEDSVQVRMVGGDVFVFENISPEESFELIIHLVGVINV